jgi:hypothetical protein
MQSLSERLDVARKAREHGSAPGLETSAYSLRARLDRPSYNGTDIRTGAELTQDDWDLRNGEVAGGLEQVLEAREALEDDDETTNPEELYLTLMDSEPVEGDDVEINLTDADPSEVDRADVHVDLNEARLAQ